MNKEAQIVEMADIIAPYFKEPIAESCQYCKSAEALYNEGYRKLPDKPPLLSDGEMLKIVNNIPQNIKHDKAITVFLQSECRAIIQAQRDICVKHYERGLNEH